MSTRQQPIRECASCGAPIVWLKHERTGRAAPIDAHETPGGNIEVNLIAGTYRLVPAVPGVRAHTNHFSICPQAPVWHKAGTRP